MLDLSARLLLGFFQLFVSARLFLNLLVQFYASRRSDSIGVSHLWIFLSVEYRIFGFLQSDDDFSVLYYVTQPQDPI